MPPTKRADAEAKVPDLAGVLAAWKAERLPLSEQAFRLRTLHGVTVTAETVCTWHLADTDALGGDAA